MNKLSKVFIMSLCIASIGITSSQIAYAEDEKTFDESEFQVEESQDEQITNKEKTSDNSTGKLGDTEMGGVVKDFLGGLKEDITESDISGETTEGEVSDFVREGNIRLNNFAKSVAANISATILWSGVALTAHGFLAILSDFYFRIFLGGMLFTKTVKAIKQQQGVLHTNNNKQYHTSNMYNRMNNMSTNPYNQNGIYNNQNGVQQPQPQQSSQSNESGISLRFQQGMAYIKSCSIAAVTVLIVCNLIKTDAVVKILQIGITAVFKVL